MTFVLFDVDGTLIDSGGAGTKSLTLAFQELFSVPDAFAGISMAGKTDPQILREGMERHGIVSANGVVPQLLRSYVLHLAATIRQTDGHVKPGVRELLDSLKARQEIVIGLLTGNVEAGARIKLRAFGLDSYFSLGAFGDDDGDRNNLLPLAVNKLRKQHGISVRFEDCVVIGDTPRDVRCAKPYGARAVAVATGPYTLGDLSATGADLVLGDLSDTRQVLSFLDMVSRGRHGKNTR